MTLQEQFNDWVKRLSRSESAPRDIIAFNFGLTQKSTGYSISVMGTKEFTEDSDDWADEADFEPREKYLDITYDEEETPDWDEVFEEVRVSIRDYTRSLEFQNSILRNAKAITLGFNDEELVRVK